jgi:hypothetical protein
MSSSKNFDFVCIDINTPNLVIRLISVYLPPHSTIIFSTVQDLCILIEEFTNPDTLIFGDFNFNWAIKPSIPNHEYLYNFMTGANLTQLVDAPTRNEAIIDLLFTSKISLVENLNIIDSVKNCDHKMLKFDLFRNIPNENKPTSTRYNFKLANFPALNNFFFNVDWKTIFKNLNDIEQIYNIFSKTILSAIDLFVPKQESKPTGVYYPSHIKNLQTYISKIGEKHPKYKKCVDTLEFHLNKFNKNREKRILSSCQTNNIYSTVRKINTVKPPIQSLLVNNIEYTSPDDISNEFAKYFHSIYAQHETNNTSYEDFDPLFDHSLMFLPDNKIFDELTNLPNKYFSPDGIPSYLLKKCAASLTSPISHIIRFSFMFSKIPQAWKKATIIPLPKISGAKQPMEFRPISLTSPLAKLTEKLLFRDIIGFIQSKGVIPPSQHGFTMGRSVDTALLEFYDDLTYDRDNKLNTDVIFLDIQKAFDSVIHTILLKKLKNIGLGPNTVNWIKELISDRTFNVSANGSLSTIPSIPIKKGVPQGSVLAPLLYNLFVHDICDNITFPNIKVKQYADDIAIYTSYNNLHKNRLESLQQSLDKISDWSKNNHLKLAVDKCKCLYFGPTNPEQTYTIDNKPISKADGNIRYLGLHFNNDLKFTHHINLKCRGALRRWFLLSKFFKQSPHNTLIMLYKVYVRPLLEFGTTIWNSNITSLSDKVEKVQRTITKIIFRKHFTEAYPVPPSYEVRLKILKLQTLKSRREIADLTMFHSMHLGRTQISDSNMPKSIPNNSRGHNFKYPRRHVRLNIRRVSFFIRAPIAYCSLPNTILSVKDRTLFRTALTKHFIDKEDK